MDWIEQCFTSPPTQYRLYGRRFLQVKRPNQQYQSTEGDMHHRQMSIHRYEEPSGRRQYLDYTNWVIQDIKKIFKTLNVDHCITPKVG